MHAASSMNASCCACCCGAQVDDFELMVQGVLEGQARRAGGEQVPLFLAGHSMGGLVAAHTVLSSQTKFAGLMLHSPALDVEWTPILR